MCTQAKAGASTWKAILVNNSADEPITQKIHNIHAHTEELDIHRLDNSRFSKQDIEMRLKTYYKFMVVRHPFTR